METEKKERPREREMGMVFETKNQQTRKARNRGEEIGRTREIDR